jgi:hypothetical protein
VGNRARRSGLPDLRTMMPISGKPEIGAVAHADIAETRDAWAKSQETISPTLRNVYGRRYT